MNKCPCPDIYYKLRSASGLKSALTDNIISNHGSIKGYSQISILSKFSDLWPIYWLGLGHTSATSLNVNLRKWEMAIDLIIGCQFENLKKDIDLRIGRRTRGLTWSETYIHIMFFYRIYLLFIYRYIYITCLVYSLK